MPKFYSELQDASLENLASDPAAGTAGRIFRNTVDGKTKIDDGSAIQSVVTEAQTQTLTNKTLTAPVIATMVSGGQTVTVPAATDTLVGRATTDTLTNKTLTSPIVNSPTINTPTIDVINLDDQASTPSTPASGLVKVYAKTNSKLYTLNSAGTETEVGAGGATGINYITNSNAETDTSGYATYADAAASTPVDGTGGVANITWTRTLTSPLRGTASFLLTKDAVNRQGQGVGCAFTIDAADQGRVLQIGFDYQIISGTYASGDVTVWVYDVTNGVLLPQPSGNSIISTSIASQQGQCTFQSSINSTSYRLIFHVASTSASAYTIEMDNISVGPQINASGSVDTDWIAYTPTFTGFGTATSISFFYRRDGSDIVIRGRFASGTSTATEGRVSFPAGFISQSTIATIELAGVGEINNTGAVGQNIGVAYAVLCEPSVGYVTFSSRSSGNTGLSKLNGSSILSSGQVLSIFARVPIAGWGSNTLLSTSGNTREVNFRAFKSAGSVTANTTIPTWTTVAKDSVGAFNSSTGEYTVRVPGDYDIAFYVQTTTGTPGSSVYVNGTQVLEGVFTGGVSTGTTGILTNLNVGDIVTVRISASLTLTTSNVRNYWTMGLRQSPQQIAASEAIAFDVNTSTTAATTSAPFIFTNKLVDTHNAYSTSTGIFTAPAPGLYQFSASNFSGGAFSTRIVINGTVRYTGNAASVSSTSIVSALIRLSTGDTVQIRPSASVTADGSAVSNFFTGCRIGGN